MWEEFIWRALAGGMGIAVMAGPVGCFVVWGRMAYFGDALAHGALLGIALGLALRIDLNLTVLLTFLVFSLLLVFLQSRRQWASDTLLGILSHGTLSCGLIAFSLLESGRAGLMEFLVGDILSVSRVDLLWIGGGGAVVLGVLIWFWRGFLAMTAQEELARAEGIPVGFLRLVLMMLVALVIALAMKIVGVLLTTALLVIPAATAREFSRSPQAMALLAACCGVVAVGTGMFASLEWDLPSGPAMVAAAALLFVLATLLGWLRRVSLGGGR